MREWTVRAQHHLITETKASFITLTYNQRYLPNTEDGLGTLRHEDFQKFMKRLRKKYPEKKISYIMCGEYGDKGRPHYHAIIYGLKYNEWGTKQLAKIWGMGRCEVDERAVNNWCIQYVLGYVKKKMITKKERIFDYKEKGKIAPYHKVSKGIGKEWALRNINSWVNNLKITTQWGEMTVPRYYIKIAKKKEGITIKWNKLLENKDIKSKAKWTKKGRKKSFRVHLEESYYIKKYETRYTEIDNPEGKYTSKIIEAQIREHFKAYEKWENWAFKTSKPFEILKDLVEDKEKIWKWVWKKCEDWVMYKNLGEQRWIIWKENMKLERERNFEIRTENRKKWSYKPKEVTKSNINEVNELLRMRLHRITSQGTGRERHIHSRL